MVYRALEVREKENKKNYSLLTGVAIDTIF